MHGGDGRLYGTVISGQVRTNTDTSLPRQTMGEREGGRRNMKQIVSWMRPLAVIGTAGLFVASLEGPVSGSLAE